MSLIAGSIVNRGNLTRKHGKVLCCMFLVAILGVDPGKTQKVIMCAHSTNQ